MAQNNNKNIKIVRAVLIGLAILLGFIAAINPLARPAAAINMFLIVIGYLIYYGNDYAKELGTFKTKNFVISIVLGAAIGLIFLLFTFLVPGFSMGFPSLPQAIGESLKAFLVIGVAPILEEIVFRGGIIAYLTVLLKGKINRAIIIHAVIFALFHLGAYILGFYQLPNFASGLSAIVANLSVFIAAFSYGLIAGFAIEKIRFLKDNLFATVPAHAIINAIAFSLAIGGFI